MRRLVIADAHVGQAAGDVDGMCRLVAAATDAGFGELIYLGDAFQYLIGFEKFWSDGVRQVLGAWDQARAEGVRVRLIEGNRDFFLDARDLSRRVDGTGLEVSFDAAGTRYLLVHGDKVNRRDWQYRFWSRLSKSAPARLWAQLLPRRLAVTIVERMERRLALTNRRFRYVKPVADLERFARRAWSDGVDVVLWGHFHTPWECHGDDRRLAMVVPAWLETRISLEIAADGSRRWLDSDLTPCPALPRMEP